MHFLKGVSVYLSGAIEACQDKGKTWRQRMTPFLEGLGLQIWDPLVKPYWVPPIDGVRQASWKRYFGPTSEWPDGSKNIAFLHNKLLRQVCLALANNCNIMIVKIDKAIPTFGTWEEVGIAQRRGIPVFFICSEKIPSMWLIDQFDAYKYPQLIFFQSDVSLFDHLQLIDNGSIEVDNIAWIFKTYKEKKNV